MIPKQIQRYVTQEFANTQANLELPDRIINIGGGRINGKPAIYAKTFKRFTLDQVQELQKCKEDGYSTSPQIEGANFTDVWIDTPLRKIPESQASDWKCWNEY